MRIFDHLYSRYVISKLKAAGSNNPDAGYLEKTTQAWLSPHFMAGGAKDRRRRAFMA